MAIGGVSSGPDLSQLNASAAELTGQYVAIQTLLMRPDSTYSQDQLTTWARSAQAIGKKILDLAAQIKAVVASLPALPSPKAMTVADVGTNIATMRTNGWLAPSALMAFISAMMYMLRQESLYAALEGQNVAKAMTMQEQLGSSEAAKQKEQGRLELKKAWVSFSIEIFSAAVQFATVAKRTTVMAKGSGSTKTRKMEKEAKEQTTENTKRIKLKEQEIAALKAEKTGDRPGEEGIANDPNRVKNLPDEKRMKEIDKKLAENNQEIESLTARNTKITENLDYQKQEILRQELVTWEQVGRGIDHFSSAAMKICEGFFAKDIKYLEAEITMLRTHLDILKNYLQSATKGESEGRQGAQEAAKAMDNYFQSHTQAYWAKAA